MLLKELDVKAFIAQANEAEQARDSDIIVYVMDLLQGANRTHPLPAWRVHHALKWAQTERFFQILAGEAPNGHLEDKR